MFDRCLLWDLKALFWDDSDLKLLHCSVCLLLPYALFVSIALLAHTLWEVLGSAMLCYSALLLF